MYMYIITVTCQKMLYHSLYDVLLKAPIARLVHIPADNKLSKNRQLQR